MASYRYIRWIVTKRKGQPENSIQMAGIRMVLGGSPINWNGSVSTTAPGANHPGPEGPTNLTDNDPSSGKFLDFNSWSSDNAGIADTDLFGNTTIVIDNTVDVTFDAYEWYTGNDAAARDPVSWTLEGSANGADWTLLDTQTDATITNTRTTATQQFDITEPSAELRTVMRGICRGIVR